MSRLNNLIRPLLLRNLAPADDPGAKVAELTPQPAQVAIATVQQLARALVAALHTINTDDSAAVSIAAALEREADTIR